MGRPRKPPPRTSEKDTESVRRRREAFASHYSITFNATESAIKAGYSKNSASSAGVRLLRDVRVQQLLKKKLQPNMDRYAATTENIVRELARIAFSDITEVKIQNLYDLPEDVRRVIKRLHKMPGGGYSVEFFSKEKALELLGKYRSMFKDIVQNTHESYEDYLRRISDEEDKDGDVSSDNQTASKGSTT